MSWEGRKCSW